LVDIKSNGHKWSLSSSPLEEDKRAKVKVLQENIWSYNDVYVDEKPTKDAIVETMIVEQKVFINCGFNVHLNFYYKNEHNI